MTFAGVLWGSCIQVLFLSIETTIGRFSIEMFALQKAYLLPTFSASVVRSLKEHVWWFNFIRDADPQLAALLVTNTFWWYSLKNLTFMPSDDFTGLCILLDSVRVSFLVELQPYCLLLYENLTLPTDTSQRFKMSVSSHLLGSYTCLLHSCGLNVYWFLNSSLVITGNGHRKVSCKYVDPVLSLSAMKLLYPNVRGLC